MSEPVRDPRTHECRACEALLASYVDGEAPTCDCERLEKHLEACGCCRDWLGRERAAREALRARRGALRDGAPERLKMRCAAYAARHPAATDRGRSLERAPIYRRWVPVSIAATVLLAVAAVVALGVNNKVEALAVQATIDHMKCSRFNTPPGVADPAAAARQWQARFGWPLRLPASAEDGGLTLRGVRRCAVTDGRVAHLIYSWMGEPLSVYVLPRQTLGEAAQYVRSFQHESVMWSQSDRTYIIVTGRPRDAALDGVVAHVRAARY